MIITDCSACSNVQCLNQVSNAANTRCACYCSGTLNTHFTCEPRNIMSTQPITIPSELASYQSINVVVDSQTCLPLNGIYTCVDCTACMYDCKCWRLDTLSAVPIHCCSCALNGCGGVRTVAIANIESSYAGCTVYVGRPSYNACDMNRLIMVYFIPGV